MKSDKKEKKYEIFNTKNKIKNKSIISFGKLKNKEIGKKIEKNIKNKSKSNNYILEVIKEEEKEKEKEKDLDINITNNIGINLEKIPDLDISRDGLKDINEILIDDK